MARHTYRPRPLLAWSSAAFTALALSLSACAALRAYPPAPAPPADPQAHLAQAIPSFGGYFIDADGTFTIYLQDPAARAEAERELAPVLRARGLEPGALRVVQGDYRYAQLLDWFAQARQVLAPRRGVLSIDLDEARQRIHIEANPSVDLAALERRLVRSGVPERAITSAHAEPFTPLQQNQSLNSVVRPPIGGLGLNGSPFGGPSCTLGFNVAGSPRSFITNSHCTDPQGGEAEDRFGQPTSASSIGVELNDPDYRRADYCPCEAWFFVCMQRARCRFSDTARIGYLPDATPALGAIARSTGRDRITGSREIDGAFRITAERANPVQGEILHKVGASTGWTLGEVTRTCVDVRGSGGRWHICQSRVRAGGRFGDSGSPVFGLLDNSNQNVALAGILWGGQASRIGQPDHEFVFSPMPGVERDLGPLATIAPNDPAPGQFPDLVAWRSPGAPGPQGFCRRAANGDLLVRIVNQSNADVLTPTITRVRFGRGGEAEQTAPPMPGGGGANLNFPIPQACAQGDCDFTIIADATNLVQEGAGGPASAGEANNIVDGVCIG